MWNANGEAYWDLHIWPNHLKNSELILAGKYEFIHRVDGNMPQEEVYSSVLKILEVTYLLCS